MAQLVYARGMWWRSLLAVAVATGCGREATALVQPVDPVPADRAPATARMRLPDNVRPLAYALELDVAPSNPRFDGRVTIDLDVQEPVRTIVLHAEELRLGRVLVTMDATAWPATPRAAGARGLTALELPKAIGPGLARLEIEFDGALATTSSGLFRADAGAEAYAFTHFQPLYARRAFPCFDEPRFKTPFAVTLNVPRGLTAVSNAAVRSATSRTDAVTTFRFAATPPIPTYLVALGVGPLDVVEAGAIAPSAVRGHAVPLRGFAPRGHGQELEFAMQETHRLLERLERHFGVPYPYEKLDLLAVPGFGPGAMENAGAVMFRDSLAQLREPAPEWARRFLTVLGAHEIAHQWFGNLVTIPWWDELWLNEGFATWIGGRVAGELHPEYHMDLERLSQLERAFDADARPSSRPVRQPVHVQDEIEGVFDAITYDKSAALLEMFERYIGADAFRAGLRRYLDRHRFGIGTSAELFSALEESSGQPIRSAFATYLDQAGAPSVAVEVRCAPGQPTRVHARQRRYAPLGSPAMTSATWQIPVCFRHEGLPDSAPRPTTSRCLLLDAAEAEFELHAPRCPRWLLPNADASGYYRWSVSASNLEALLGVGWSELSSIERLSLLSNTEAAVRSGDTSFERLMQVTRQVGLEPELRLVQAALDVLSRLRETLLTDADLPGYRRFVGELYGPRQRQFGLASRGQRDEGTASLLRAALTWALAIEARDPLLRRELERFGRRHLESGLDERDLGLSAELVDVALIVAIQESGAPMIERGMTVLTGVDDPMKRSRLLWAMGNNQDPARARLVLNLALADGLRTNERLKPVLGQLAQRETREIAYAWIEQHFDALRELVGGEAAVRLLSAAGSLCTTAETERARQFFTPRAAALSGGAETLRQQLEKSESCAAFVAAHRASARAYFAAL